ncbi:polymorphic toxin type 44 domain-containing protein [Fusibacter sp. 3D3]|uniref:polymorphic toxin type 44 domain-containing protein n=1 Tax=Fusibacter sp. 3D3 TaxID=1048380 RepID=UPI0009FEA345
MNKKCLIDICYLWGVTSIGNLHYGVVGSVLFGSTTLKSAAGMYQIFQGTSSFSYFSSYFDDPNDTVDVVTGIGYHSSWKLNKVL